jgi:hypothetical protein
MSSFIKLNWGWTSHDIQTVASNLIRDWKHVQEKVLGLPKEQQTFMDCIVPFALAEGHYETGSSNCHILSQVSPDKAVREASLAANKQLEVCILLAALIIRYVQWLPTNDDQTFHSDLGILRRNIYEQRFV